MYRLAMFLLGAAGCVLLPGMTAAQGVTGALIGTVKDAQGGVVPGAVVRVSSAALIGGAATLTTNEKGQLRFPALPPGSYVLDIEMPGFATYHEADIPIGAGATIERTLVGTLSVNRAHREVSAAPARIDRSLVVNKEVSMKNHVIRALSATRLNSAIVAGLGAVLLVGVTVYAATSTIHGTGTIAYYEPFDGPATMTVRSLFIKANEVLPWHQHGGIGAYTIVKTGTLTVEDGCGGHVVYPQGTAFVEPPGRVTGGAPVPSTSKPFRPLWSRRAHRFHRPWPRRAAPPRWLTSARRKAGSSSTIHGGSRARATACTT